MKFRDLVEGTMDKKLLAAAEKLIIKMKKDKEHNNKIIKALEINFPSLDALKVLGDFKNARVDESHFEIGDEVICKASGSEGKIVKIDEPEEGKYYTVELEDGTTKKYAPEELSLEDEDEDELEEAIILEQSAGKSVQDITYLCTKIKSKTGPISMMISTRKVDKLKGYSESKFAKIVKDLEKVNSNLDTLFGSESIKESVELSESQDADFVLQSLADADINASIEGNIVMVDKSDVRGAQKVLKAIGCSRKVKAGLNENIEDMQPASPDEESMAMDQARFVRYVSKEIMEYLQQGNDFPEWMQNKLTELNVKAKDFHSVMAGRYKMDEGEEDVIFSKEMNGQELKVHVHDGKFVVKINGKELK